MSSQGVLKINSHLVLLMLQAGPGYTEWRTPWRLCSWTITTFQLLFSAIWAHKGKRLGKVSRVVTRFYLSPMNRLPFEEVGLSLLLLCDHTGMILFYFIFMLHKQNASFIDISTYGHPTFSLCSVLLKHKVCFCLYFMHILFFFFFKALTCTNTVSPAGVFPLSWT